MSQGPAQFLLTTLASANGHTRSGRFADDELGLAPGREQKLLAFGQAIHQPAVVINSYRFHLLETGLSNLAVRPRQLTLRGHPMDLSLTLWVRHN